MFKLFGYVVRVDNRSTCPNIFLSILGFLVGRDNLKKKRTSRIKTTLKLKLLEKIKTTFKMKSTLKMKPTIKIETTLYKRRPRKSKGNLKNEN